MNHAILPTAVSCGAHATVQVTSPIRHLCPFVDEVDDGTVTVSWTCQGETFELHSLAAYLAAWVDCSISHEALCDRIRHDLASASEQIKDVVVAATFTTAGMAVEVGCGGPLHGEPVHPAGS